jgi:hypothetical protein
MRESAAAGAVAPRLRELRGEASVFEDEEEDADD